MDIKSRFSLINHHLKLIDKNYNFVLNKQLVFYVNMAF